MYLLHGGMSLIVICLFIAQEVKEINPHISHSAMLTNTITAIWAAVTDARIPQADSRETRREVAQRREAD